MWEVEEHWDNRFEYRTHDGYRASILRMDWIKGIDPILYKDVPGTYLISLTFGPILVWTYELRRASPQILSELKVITWARVMEHTVERIMSS